MDGGKQRGNRCERGRYCFPRGLTLRQACRCLAHAFAGKTFASLVCVLAVGHDTIIGQRGDIGMSPAAFLHQTGYAHHHNNSDIFTHHNHSPSNSKAIKKKR